MPRFGSQFNNTYFNPEDGGETQEFRHPYQEGHLQGVLFHPATGTMTSEDPTYPEKKRLNDFSKILKTNDSNLIHQAGKTDLPIAEMDPSVVGLHPRDGIFNGVRINNKLKTYGGTWSSTNRQINMSGNSSSMDTTLAHEWGHREDSPDGKGEDHSHTRLEGAMYDKGRMHVSPYMEGTADGYMERYSEPYSNIKWEGDPKGIRKAVGYNRRHEAVLDPEQKKDRHLDLWKKTGELPGYGVDSKNWKNKQEMALYAAARLHVASGGKSAIDSLPNMTELAETHLSDYGQTLYKKDRDRVMKSGKGFARLPHDIPEYKNAAKHLYLGKLVHENPSLHGQLDKMGLGEISTYSQDFYKHHVANTALVDRENTERAMDLYDNRQADSERPYNNPMTNKIEHGRDPYVRMIRPGEPYTDMGMKYRGKRNQYVDGKYLSVQHTLPGMEQYDELTVNAAANPMPKPLAKKQLARTDDLHLQRNIKIPRLK
jgi:hypothetical protein